MKPSFLFLWDVYQYNVLMLRNAITIPFVNLFAVRFIIHYILLKDFDQFRTDKQWVIFNRCLFLYNLENHGKK